LYWYGWFFYYGKAEYFAESPFSKYQLIFGVIGELNAVFNLNRELPVLVLTIGYVGDANVLIFERIKEELSEREGAEPGNSRMDLEMHFLLYWMPNITTG